MRYANGHIIMPQFSFLKRVALFYPEGEVTTSGEEDPKKDPGATDGNDNPDDDARSDKKKLVTLERHKAEVEKLKAKIRSFEDAEAERKKAELSDTDRLKAEKTELENRLAKFEANEMKMDAFAKAKAALAKDGRVIDPEKEDALQRSLRRMTFDSETIDDDVAEMVQIASMPKGSGYRTAAGKSSSQGDDRDPREYTAQELKEIYKESPERWKAVMEKRKQLAAADKAKGNK